MTIKLDKNEKKRNFGLTIFYSVVSFLAMLADIVVVAVIISILVNVGALEVLDDSIAEEQSAIIFMALLSIVFGCGLSFLTNRIVVKPINDIISGMNRMASGDYDVKLKFSKAVRKIPTISDVESSFNKLSDELSNTEMLRADFINNFSHEFKTPILSISGFAKLLRSEDLSDEEREQYLLAIEEESARLAQMSSNVLSLTKVENQTILNDKSEYNLSEQIRGSFLLLEPKWRRRDIEFELDFSEHFVSASEEMLKEVWINLIDNAIKFTPEGGRICVDISDGDRDITVRISNTGDEIPPENLEKIFGKFYQLDKSHSAKGSGIGLAIVKRIVELHGGAVSAESAGGMNVFTVVLPQI